MFLKQAFFWIFLICTVLACEPISEEPNAEAIIAYAIANAGGDYFEGSTIQFDFRDRHYQSYRKAGNFELQRISVDSAGNKITDMLTNAVFQRFIGDSLVNLADTMAEKYASSVNSVHYFAYLPFGLNDPAVKSKYLGLCSIKNKPYHKLEITFNEENGGKDFNDKFLYWIDPVSYTIDYLAYQYFTNNGGIRFREAYNVRKIEGIQFSDYKNYTAPSSTIFYSVDSLYIANKLEFLSDIKLENVIVSRTE